MAAKPSNFIEENGAAFDAENLSMVEYNHSPSKLPLVLNTNGNGVTKRKGEFDNGASLFLRVEVVDKKVSTNLFM